MPPTRVLLIPVAVVMLVGVALGAAWADQDRRVYAGRRVAEVLRELQLGGLPLIFSDDLVPPMLRVKAEPKGTSPRQIAIDILAPYDLTLLEGPRGKLIVVAAPRTPCPAGSPSSLAREPSTPRQSSNDSPQSSDETLRLEER